MKIDAKGNKEVIERLKMEQSPRLAELEERCTMIQHQ